MLFFQDEEDLIAVSQPAHAWLAGQLARAWGNAEFGAVEPREEVCLAAEQHDLAWLEWERAPTLDAELGRPHHFLRLPLETHLAMWAAAGPSALAYGRYPALLVSMHGSRLYAARDGTGDTPSQARAVARYLAAAGAFEAGLIAALRADPACAAHAAPHVVARNQRLVAVWDWISLLLCGGLRAPVSVDGVPAAAGETRITLAPRDGRGLELRADAWPFRAPRVTLCVEGRRVTGRYRDEAQMRAALASAPWVPLRFSLQAA